MTLLADQALPSLKKLRAELPADLFVDEAENERPLQIAILNLMPTAVCERTEMQFMRLLAGTRHLVRPTFIYFDQHKSNSNQAHFDEFYKTIADVKKSGLDGLIITGANLEDFAFEDVKYWEEFIAFLDWAREQVPSIIFSCWAMHAALYHYYHIEPVKNEKKQFGIFRHLVHHETHSPLLVGLDDEVFLPHSRWRGELKERLEANPKLQILMENDEVGVHLVATKDGRQIFVQGHPEYDRGDIAEEYFRDKKKGIDIDMPKNYFENEDETKPATNTWGVGGQLFYTNWINWLWEKTRQ